MVELLSNKRRLKEESEFVHGIMGDLVKVMIPNEVWDHKARSPKGDALWCPVMGV
jgi:hypothetical protein